MNAILRALIDGLMSVTLIDHLTDSEAKETVIGMMPAHSRDGIAHIHSNN